MCGGWISQQHRGSVGALACPHARPTGRNRKEVERWKKIGGGMKNLHTHTHTHTHTFATPIGSCASRWRFTKWQGGTFNGWLPFRCSKDAPFRMLIFIQIHVLLFNISAKY